MKRTGIPASITMAQGILESGNGNSMLAKKANNHFGIKCHDWTGPSVKMDDDEKDECFRKYKNSYESYKDHSKFLTTRSRYAFLFKYPSDDYKRWAHGLKKAGYATNPRYAHLLIKIIEDERLYELDKKDAESKFLLENEEQWASGNDVDKEAEIDYWGLRLEVANGIHYIVTKKGDTFYGIERNLGVERRKLLKYNDLPRNYVLQINQRLYLHNKKNKSDKASAYHRVEGNESLYDISQQYGVKLKKICKYNRVRKDYKPRKGELIWLRKRRQ